jgi:hypothetical protein
VSLSSVETDTLSAYLNTLFGENQGWIYAPTLDRAAESFQQHFFMWPTQRTELIQHVQLVSQGRDVYIAPALFKSNTDALKENILGSNVVWCEFDGNTPSFGGSEADGATLGHLPEPTIRVQSSEKGWEHWYWSLSEFTDDIKRVEHINRGLTYQLGADSSGWDINQILRPPTSLNHKRGGVPVQVVHAQPLSYPIDSFAGLPAPETEITEFTAADTFDALDVVAKYPWTRQAWTFFRTKPPVGERSTALMRLGYFCAEMGMSDQEIFSILYNADDRWDKFKGRRDRDRRLCDIIIKARIKHPKQESALQTLEVLGLQSLLASEVTVQWTIPDLLQQHGSLILSGPPGLGKTQLSLHFAIQTVLGRGYLHYEAPIGQQKIIYFSLEMSHAGIKYFLSQMVTPLNAQELELLEKHLLIVPLGEALYLDQEIQQRMVEAVIEKYSPDGIFIDSLGSTTPDELSSESTAKAIFDWEARLRKKYETFVWWIHHNRKANTLNKAPNKLDDVYGNRYIQARPDTIISLWGQPGSGTFKFITLKQRYAETIKPYTVKRNGIFFSVDETASASFEGLVLESDPENVVDYSQAPSGLSNTL